MKNLVVTFVLIFCSLQFAKAYTKDEVMELTKNGGGFNISENGIHLNNNIYCILYPTEVSQFNIKTTKNSATALPGLNVKNRYTKSNYQFPVRIYYGSTISNSDADLAAVGSFGALLFVGPLLVYTAKGITDAFDSSGGSSKLYQLLEGLYQNPYNLCKSYPDDGNLEYE